MSAEWRKRGRSFLVGGLVTLVYAVVLLVVGFPVGALLFALVAGFFFGTAGMYLDPPSKP